ncbi:hypothetical protein ACFE04_008394 [Oxalis oulophora]
MFTVGVRCAGFISLDCGLQKDTNYTEETTTGINYISDANYVETGQSFSIQQEFKSGCLRQVWTLRSFPQGTRNCYTLNLTSGDKYLIRAYFLYGNYDQKNQTPEFDLYLGVNHWTNVKIENASRLVVKDIVHVLSSDYLDVCLVDIGSGTPFMSALELRLLNETMYRTQIGSLNYFSVLDIGSNSSSILRYKDDIYDRLWIPATLPNCKLLSAADNATWLGQNVYQPPLAALKTAAAPKNDSDPLIIEWKDNNTNVGYYVYFHFAELEVLEKNETREMRITFNKKSWYGPFEPRYLLTNTAFSVAALTGGDFRFEIHKTATSTHPPILNAVEIYQVAEFNQPQTYQADVDAIKNLKLAYEVTKNWQGDPCAPRSFLWDGLNCTYTDNDPPRITSLNLSSSGLNGEIPSSISNLTSLQVLDLSNNNLKGSVSAFLAQLPSLITLNLQNNKLTGSLLANLVAKQKDGALSLSVDGNPNLCESFPCKKKKMSVIVPIVASVVLISAILAAWLLLRRKKKVNKASIFLSAVKKVAKPHIRYDSFEKKSRGLTYSEVLKITNNFQKIIGKGGFGTVYHGYLDDIQVAVKLLSPSSTQGYKQFEAEVNLLLRVHHKNLTALIGYCYDGTNMGLIYEFMSKGNLAEHLIADSRNILLNWETRLQIALDAAQGLEYLHNGCKPPIVHRDVKSTNILLNDKFEAKLADFGLSRTFSFDSGAYMSTVFAGTPGYLDPEYYLSNRLTEKSDVYSFGIVLLEIITSKSVIEEICSDDNQCVNIHISQYVGSKIKEGDVKSIVDPRLKEVDFNTNTLWRVLEIAMACVSHVSTRRPTMSQVVAELSECLAAEKMRRKGGEELNENEEFGDVCITLNLNDDDSAPLAR